jgi:hypothetical protein
MNKSIFFKEKTLKKGFSYFTIILSFSNSSLKSFLALLLIIFSAIISSILSTIYLLTSLAQNSGL